MNQITFISKSLEEKLHILSELFKKRNSSLKEFTPDETEYDTDCYDYSYQTEKGKQNIKDTMEQDTDIILFFIKQTNKIFCMDINYLYGFIKNKRVNVFFECRKKDNLRTVDYENPYFKIDFGAIRGLVALEDIRGLLESPKRVFYVIPKLKDGNQVRINYTISWGNILTTNQNYVSSNHCQENSNYNLYEIRVCKDTDGENNCLVNVLDKGKKKDTKFIRYITDVLTPSSSDIKDVVDDIDDRYKEQLEDIETEELKRELKIEWLHKRTKLIKEQEKLIKDEKDDISYKIEPNEDIEELKNVLDETNLDSIVCLYRTGIVRYKTDEIPDNLEAVLKIKVEDNAEFYITERTIFDSPLQSIMGNGKVILQGDMSYKFDGCKNFNSDLSKWEVGKVTDMSDMFYGCESFNSDLSKWKVDKVTDMNNMFYGCKNFNSDLSKWQVGKVTNMSDMFSDATNFNSNLSKWDVGKVEDMSSMFKGASNFDKNNTPKF